MRLFIVIFVSLRSVAVPVPDTVFSIFTLDRSLDLRHHGLLHAEFVTLTPLGKKTSANV